MFRRLALSGLVSLAICTGAHASPLQDWSGAHAGVFAGYGFGRTLAGPATDPALFFPFYNALNNPYRFEPDGALLGVQAGFDRQWGAVVAGLDAELGYLGLRGSAIDPNGTIFFGTPDTETSFRSDLYGALGGRLGVAAGRALVYGRAGAALLRARASTIDACAGVAGCGTTTLAMRGRETLFGWSLGGGAEWRIAPGWSLKAEYVYFDFGDIETSGPGSTPGEFYRQSIGVRVQTVRLGLSYRFGPARR